MASSKNSGRKKRKYGPERALRTNKNKIRRQTKGEAHIAKLVARTHALVGTHVAVRVKDYARPIVGTVLEVIGKDHDEYPHQARRHHGNYLKVRCSIGDLIASRHRIRPIKES